MPVCGSRSDAAVWAHVEGGTTACEGNGGEARRLLHAAQAGLVHRNLIRNWGRPPTECAVAVAPKGYRPTNFSTPSVEAVEGGISTRTPAALARCELTPAKLRARGGPLGP